MTFFTTPELLEIGDMPFSTPNQKPTRSEALEYYRKVAEHYSLDVRPYETVESVSGHDGEFTVHTADRFGRPIPHRARKLVLATGYYDLPNIPRHPRRRAHQGEALLRRSPPLTTASMSPSSAARTPPPSPRSNYGDTARASPWSIAAPRCTTT